MGNFVFLKSIDKNLFKIADEAEHLYRDEYFDQCITQTRKFGENICRNILEDECSSDDTFDALITKLKDISTGSDMEKEFIQDLYFIKKEGNKSTHGKSGSKNGIVALEFLKRIFELSISYCVQKKGVSKKLLRSNYDVDLLILDKKMPEKRLVDEYLKRSDYKKSKLEKETKKKPKKNNEEKSTYTKRQRLSFKYKFVIFSIIFFVCICLFFLVLKRL